MNIKIYIHHEKLHNFQNGLIVPYLLDVEKTRLFSWAEFNCDIDDLSFKDGMRVQRNPFREDDV